MYGEEAVTAVMREISSLGLEGFDGGIIKYETESPTGEYIAVNHLPFVYGSVVAEGIVNVNVHVPKLKNNEINTKRLSRLWMPIADDFRETEEQPYGKQLEGAFFSFYSHSRPTLDSDGTYYVNVQIKVTYNNLK